jgi:rhodanese-related sulfurtransferase
MTPLEFFQARIENTLTPMSYMTASKQNPDEYVVVDVRNAPPHLKKVKIAGAVEIPLNEMENRLSELAKDKTIVLYCWDSWCTMAAHAAVILLKNDYKANELSGDIAAWQALNLPVETL